MILRVTRWKNVSCETKKFTKPVREVKIPLVTQTECRRNLFFFPLANFLSVSLSVFFSPFSLLLLTILPCSHPYTFCFFTQGSVLKDSFFLLTHHLSIEHASPRFLLPLHSDGFQVAFGLKKRKRVTSLTFLVML